MEFANIQEYAIVRQNGKDQHVRYQNVKRIVITEHVFELKMRMYVIVMKIVVGKEINATNQIVNQHVFMEIASTTPKLNSQNVAVRMNGKDQLAANQFVIQFVMRTELAKNQEYVNVNLDGKGQDV